MARVFDGQPEGLTRDDILDNITLYWLTNTGVSSARLYWENKPAFFDVKNVPIPVAVSIFPDEIYAAPAELDRACVSQTDPLQPPSDRLPLRGLGTAAIPFRRDSRGLQITAQIASHGSRSDCAIIGSRRGPMGAPIVYEEWEGGALT
jgi:hypothetical protein